MPDAAAAVAELVEHGATSCSTSRTPATGIRVARVRDPLGNVIGIIENPIFELPADATAPGPGR